MVIGSRQLLPQVAILDAELFLSLPSGTAAATGMDALTHAIESYTSTLANPITEALALHSIKLVSASEPELGEETIKTLVELGEPVHLQVFVTPTCPHCQASVMLAHEMAVASPMVRADMVEAMEFPHLATKYQVSGVPRTVINETTHIVGAVPEPTLMEKLREALAGAGEQDA